MLDERIERDDGELAVLRVRRGDRGAERGAHGFDDLLGVLRRAGALRDHLEDAHEVADADAFVEQHLQHALDLAGRDVRAVQLVDHDRIALLHDVDEHLHVLAAEQPARVAADDLGEVRGDDRRAVDDGRAGDLGLVAELDRDPRGGEPEDGFAGGDAGERARVVAEHEHVTGRRFAAADVDTVDAHRVRARRELEVVARAHERDDDAELERELAPQRAHAVEQVAALGRVDEVDEVVRDLELERLDAHLADEVLGRVGRELDGRGLDFLLGRGLGRDLVVARQPGREQEDARRRR